MGQQTLGVVVGLTGFIMMAVAGASQAEARVIGVPGDYPAIQAAVNAATSGDTVLVDAGVYKEIVRLRGGVRLHAVYGGERQGSQVILDARYLTPPDLDDYAIAWPTTSDRIEVVGFIIVSDRRGAVLVRGSNHLVERNTMDAARFGGTGSSIIRLQEASNCAVVENRIYGPLDYAIGIELMDSAANWLIHNTIEARHVGIQIRGGPNNQLIGNVSAAIGGPGVTGVAIAQGSARLLHNTVYAADAADQMAEALRVENSEVSILNSILIAESQSGGSWGIVSQGSSTVVVRYSNVRGGTQHISGPGVTVGAGVIFSDPQFVASDIDFRLQAGSPARNMGLGKDRDGTRADMGAYGGIH